MFLFDYIKLTKADLRLARKVDNSQLAVKDERSVDFNLKKLSPVGLCGIHRAYRTWVSLPVMVSQYPCCSTRLR